MVTRGFDLSEWDVGLFSKEVLPYLFQNPEPLFRESGLPHGPDRRRRDHSPPNKQLTWKKIHAWALG